MKRTYKTDIGSLVFVGFGILLFLIPFIFVFNEGSLFMKCVGIFVITFLIFLFFSLLKYDLIITDECLSAKIPALSLFNVYQTMRFDEIEIVWNAIGLIPEVQNIIFKSKDKSKKLMSITVGFGLPWDALLDILERLPKDTKVTFEPELWKRIKNPLRNDRVRKINLVALIVILSVVTWFSYFLLCILKLHRVPFPINFFLGNPQGRL